VEKPLEEALSNWKRGDRTAFDILFRSRVRRMYAIARSRGLSREDAEDATQETFAKVAMKRNRINNLKHFDALLCLCCRDAVSRARLRNAKYVCTDYLEDARVVSLSAHGENPLELVIRAEKWKLIQRRIQKFSERDREIIRLLKVEGFTTSELAEALDVSLSRAKYLRERANTLFKEAVRQAQRVWQKRIRGAREREIGR